MKQYMVDFTMPLALPENYAHLIPEQRERVNQFFMSGKLLSYTLALESGKLWAVFRAETESELFEMVGELPLSEHMKWRYHELTFYNAAHTFIPSFSVN